MLKTEQAQLFAMVSQACGEYLKPPTSAELESWWMTCKVFTLHDVERALKAHATDSDDGKRVPRPIDVKRRLMSSVRSEERVHVHTSEFEARLARYNEEKIRAPSMVNTAHMIALRHGSRPWQTDGRRIQLPPHLSRDEGR